MKAKVFISFCFLFIFTIFLTNVSAVTIGDLYSKDNVFTVKNLTTGETKEVTIPKFTKGDFSKATNYVLVYKNENDYFFQFTSDNKNYIVVYSIISGGYEIRHNGYYQVIGSNVYYQTLGDYYLSSSGNLYDENVYIYSTCDLYKVTDRDEAMQEDLPENAELITSGSMEDDTIGDPNSRLQISYEYNEDNTECKINATIKDGAFTDKIFYSNDLPSITGQGLITKKAFPIDGITITDNQALFFQAEDKDGNIIATNSVSINGLGILSDDKFSVKFEFNNNKMDFTPSISMDQYAYYSIFFKLSNSDFIESSDFNNLSENNQVENNYTYRIISTSDKEITFDIIFEIMNNKTGSICLTKSYKIRLSKYSIDSVGEGIIVGGIIGDRPSGVVGDNESIGDLDWSFSNSVNNIKDFFNNAKEFFNLVLIFINDLPSWIVAPLYTLLVFAVILFVYHLLRG